MNNMGCIYLITNIINNKQYVGKTIYLTPDKRYKRHWSSSLRIGGLPKNDNCPLHRAMRKYGYESFKIETLCMVSRESLDNMEAYWAEVLETYIWDKPLIHPPGYNATWCGVTGWLGMKHSKSSLAKMSKAHTGVIQSPGTRLKISIANLGRIVTKETRFKISVAHKGKKLSKYTKMLLSIAHKGMKASPETRAKMRLNHSNFWTGHRHRPDSRAKMSASQTGKVQSADLIEKRIAPLRGRKQSVTQIENARAGRIESLIENGAKNVKLNKEKVLEIVRLKAEGIPQTSIAKQFSVADSVVSRILSGDRWGHVTGIKPVEK